MYYAFLLNMWIMRKVDGEYLSAMVTKKRITEEERLIIMVVPQLPEE